MGELLPPILTLAGVVVGAVSVELAQGRPGRAEVRLLPFGRIADMTPPTTAEIGSADRG